LVISKNNKIDLNSASDRITVAIPGKYTTANFLFSLVYPDVANKRELLFSEIEDEVLAGKVDWGVIIHENRFTYEQRGLHKVIDLGEYWEEETGCPIPLGGIVIKRSLENELQRKVDRVLRRSVEFAMDNPTSSLDYVRMHAQEMDPEVIKQHIELYVNQYSVDLGEEGRSAITTLFDKAVELKIFERPESPLILDLGY